MHVEPHHPDLFWYGIHGVEILFTVMGPGCETVTRVGPEKVVGRVERRPPRDLRRQPRERAMAPSSKARKQSGNAGKYDGYAPLVVEIVKFFKTGKPPVSAEETLEILAFMEAADESKRHNGEPVTIESVMKKAERQIAEQSR